MVSATAESQVPGTAPTPEAQRVRDVFEMYEFGVALYRQRMRREHPGADEAEVEALTREWLISPPRPERLREAMGDALGAQAW